MFIAISHFHFSAFESGGKEASTPEQRVTARKSDEKRGKVQPEGNLEQLQQTVTDLQDQVRLLHNHNLYNYQRIQYMSLQMYSMLQQHPQGFQQQKVQPMVSHLSKFGNGLLVQGEKGLAGPLQEWIINASKNGKNHSGQKF